MVKSKFSLPQIPGKKAVQKSVKEHQQMYRTAVTRYIEDSTFRNFYRHMDNIKRKAFYEKRSFKPLNSKEWHKRFVMKFFQLPAVWKPLTSKDLESAAYKNKMIMFEVFGPPTMSFYYQKQPSPMLQLRPQPTNFAKDFEFFMPTGHKQRLEIINQEQRHNSPEYLRDEKLIMEEITALENFNEDVIFNKDMIEIEAIKSINESDYSEKIKLLERIKDVIDEKANATEIQREEFIARDVEIAEDAGLQILAAAFAAFVAEPPPQESPQKSPNAPRPSLFIKIPQQQVVKRLGKYTCSHCKIAGHTRAKCNAYKAIKSSFKPGYETEEE